MAAALERPRPQPAACYGSYNRAGFDAGEEGAPSLTRPSSPTLELTIVIPTIQGWPRIRETLRAIQPQAEGRPIEVIVVDASEGGQPPEEARWPGLRWLRAPGLTVYRARPRGYREAGGQIVAVTEDHCIPAQDWVDRILAAHRAHPEAVVVGGALENGSDRRALHRASFLVTHARFAPPLRGGPTKRIPGAANLSFKRRALERLPDHATLGAFEGLDAAAMLRDGEVLLLDDRIRVQHHHEFDLPAESAIQFHDGRTVSGLRRSTGMEARDWVRLGLLGVLPLMRTGRTLATGLRKGIPPGRLAGELPLIQWLQYCHAAGELVGYAMGPGSSPRKLV